MEIVPGRLISDNVLITYESVHAMKKRKRGKNSVCAVKLDMMKPYDRRHCLQFIMLKLGFSAGFVRLIIKCVTTVRFTVRMMENSCHTSHHLVVYGKAILSCHIFSYCVKKGLQLCLICMVEPFWIEE